MPEISLLNRQRARTIDLRPLSRFAQRALEKVEVLERTALPAEIVAVLVSDRRISTIHLQFMQIAGPTDVITFQHGDIIISVETAHRQATQLGKELLDELCLYLLHGLLHLAGYDDTTNSGFREMQRLQQRLMREIGSNFDKRSRRQILNRSSQRSQRREHSKNAGRNKGGIFLWDLCDRAV